MPLWVTRDPDSLAFIVLNNAKNRVLDLSRHKFLQRDSSTYLFPAFKSEGGFLAFILM